MRRLVAILAVFLMLPFGMSAGVTAQATTSLATPVPNSETTKLIAAINAYRAEHNLPPIPMSPELTTVAMDHVHDLMKYAKTAPEYTGTDCVPHGWSSNGPWKGGCYKYGDPASGPLMWDKPKEIANYPGDGFEILFWSSDKATADDALKGWQSDAPHNDVILNQDIWKDMTWRAIGVWVEDGYASVWFGEQTDPTPATSGAAGNQQGVGAAPMLPSMKATTPMNGGAPLPPNPANPPAGQPTPTMAPNIPPTELPTELPTMMPTAWPTEWPTMMPTEWPTEWPTMMPTEIPVELPTMVATMPPD